MFTLHEARISTQQWIAPDQLPKPTFLPQERMVSSTMREGSHVRSYVPPKTFEEYFKQRIMVLIPAQESTRCTMTLAVGSAEPVTYSPQTLAFTTPRDAANLAAIHKDVTELIEGSSHDNSRALFIRQADGNFAYATLVVPPRSSKR